MADLFDYLHWRGDLTFRQVPVTPVDALIFSALSYLNFDGRVAQQPEIPVSLRDAAQEVLAMTDRDTTYQAKVDMNLLEKAAQSTRFGNALLMEYRNTYIPEEETQFAAITYLLDDDTAFIAFRGTDQSIIGWKEDFNMSFQDSVPAQRLAVEYTKEIADRYPMPLYGGGHSKGGSVAVCAASKSESHIRARIKDVYNHDGPGFKDMFLQDPSYLEMVPRIRTIIPQSSVIGMLLEHEEPYTVIQSNQKGILQHDLYTWMLEGPGFVPMKEVTSDSLFLNLTIREWLASMSMPERNEVVDAVFDLLNSGDVDSVDDLLKPQNIAAFIRTLSGDNRIRQILGREFMDLLDAARKTQRSLNVLNQKDELPDPEQKLAQEIHEEEERKSIMAELFGWHPGV